MFTSHLQSYVELHYLLKLLVYHIFPHPIPSFWSRLSIFEYGHVHCCQEGGVRGWVSVKIKDANNDDMKEKGITTLDLHCLKRSARLKGLLTIPESATSYLRLKTKLLNFCEEIANNTDDLPSETTKYFLQEFMKTWVSLHIRTVWSDFVKYFMGN